MIQQLFHIPENYKNTVKNYNYVDAIFAIAVYILYCSTMITIGFLSKSLSTQTLIIIGEINNLIFTGIILILLKIRGNCISSIGFQKGNIKITLIFGLSLSFILFFCNCLSNIIFDGQKLISTRKIFINIFYYFTVALCEEVIFRGYIQTRIHPLFKNILLDILITGILFVLMHFPYRMVAYNKSFLDILSNIQFMLDLFITHIILSLIRIKSDSLYGSILPHWISDLAYSIVTHL